MNAAGLKRRGLSPIQMIESDFVSQNVRCAGTLLLPAQGVAPPVIVMAHGFGAVRDAGLHAFADRFLAAGYAVFLFDYRGFGDSAGEQRQWVSPRRQLQDWRAAITHVRSLKQVDRQRVVLWGVSFSGGHVIRLAAEDRHVSAVVALVPHVDGLASTLQVPVWTSLRLFAAGVLDLVGGLFGMPCFVPTVGRSGECAALTSPGALDGYLKLIPKGSRWENRTRARVFLGLPFYSPIRHAHRVQAPTLVIAGRRDSITPPSAAQRAAQRLPHGKFEWLHSDHFQLFVGELFETNVALQLGFLREAVPLSSPARRKI